MTLPSSYTVPGALPGSRTGSGDYPHFGKRQKQAQSPEVQPSVPQPAVEELGSDPDCPIVSSCFSLCTRSPGVR